MFYGIVIGLVAIATLLGVAFAIALNEAQEIWRNINE